MPDCENCNERCRKAEMAHEIALGRMYATNNLVKLIKKIESGQLVEVVKCQECKHHYWEQEPCHGKSVHYCKLPHMRGVEVFKEFFCYYGKRKDGDK